MIKRAHHTRGVLGCCYTSPEEMTPANAFRQFCEDLYSPFGARVVSLTATAVTVEYKTYSGFDVRVIEYVGFGVEICAIRLLAALDVLWRKPGELTAMALLAVDDCVGHIDPKEFRLTNDVRDSRMYSGLSMKALHAVMLAHHLGCGTIQECIDLGLTLVDVLSAHQLGQELHLSVREVIAATVAKPHAAHASL